MILLLDANLSWRMLAVLQKHFTGCYHVDRIDELKMPARDSEIWNYAKNNNFIIVTNDEDFIDIINVKGFPPKIVLLRTGNQSRLFLSNLLIQRKTEIELLESSTETGLLEIISKE
jgi:predicted nuclease of predicted toxin-antitoxin system